MDCFFYVPKGGLATMRRILFALLALSLLASGCCSTCHKGCSCCEAEDDDYCLCCTDGSESPWYHPPGPFWSRPDYGCPDKCLTYQRARKAMKQDARRQMYCKWSGLAARYQEEEECYEE